MSIETSLLSIAFTRLYCNPALFDCFSSFHPISFRRVLPFRLEDQLPGDSNVLRAEEAHLAAQNDSTRQSVVDAYVKCNLLQELEGESLTSAIDYFDVDFFELMGLVYSNAGLFRRALRWQREAIAHLETARPDSVSDSAGAYASVGYCLYSLGLFEEAISWSKSCIGPRPISEAIARSLILYEAQVRGGAITIVERVGPRTRYTVTSLDPVQSTSVSARLKEAMGMCAHHDVSIAWVTPETPIPERQPEDHPFRPEFDGGNLVRHKLNLIFSTCHQADALVERGYMAEAKRLLSEAAMLEPEAHVVRERLKLLVQ